MINLCYMTGGQDHTSHKIEVFAKARKTILFAQYPIVISPKAIGYSSSYLMDPFRILLNPTVTP